MGQVIRFPDRRGEAIEARVPEESALPEECDFDPRLLDPRVDWSRMGLAAIERALGLRPLQCRERREYEDGRRDRRERRRPDPAGGLSYRSGFAGRRGAWQPGGRPGGRRGPGWTGGA